MCPGIAVVNRNYGEIVLIRTVTSLMTLLFFIQFKLWSNFWKFLMATKAGFRRVKPKLEYISWQQSHLYTIHSIFVSSRYYKKWQNYSHSNIRAIWWNCDLVFRPMILKSRVSERSDYDIIFTSQDIGLQTSTLSNRLLNMNTEGNDQGLIVTSSSYGTQEAVTKASGNMEQVTSSLQNVRPGCHLNIKRPCLPVLCGMELHIHAIHVYNMPTQLHPRGIFGMWLYIISMLVDENIPLHPCHSGHPILGCWWKFPVCVSDSLSFECGTNKYWNIRSKVKMVIISESIVSWDARISNYTTTALPQGSVGCD